jgi:predicted ester cyclase
MSVEQNKAIALRLATKGWGTVSGWEKVWDELVAEDMIQHFCGAKDVISGLEANKVFQASLFEGFPQIKQTIEAVVAEDDKVVYFHTLEGSQTGTFMGIPPTHKWVKGTGFTMVRIANGKVVEMWYETNLLEIMQQMGVISRDN